MKRFLYCFRIDIAVVGAHLWENHVLILGSKKKIVITFAVNMYLLNIQAALLLSPTFHAMYPALRLLLFLLPSFYLI